MVENNRHCFVSNLKNTCVFFTSAHSRATDVKTLACSQVLTAETQTCASFRKVLLAMEIDFLWNAHVCDIQEEIAAMEHLLKQADY